MASARLTWSVGGGCRLPCGGICHFPAPYLCLCAKSTNTVKKGCCPNAPILVYPAGWGLGSGMLIVAKLPSV